MLVVFAISDARNAPPAPGTAPVVVGLLVVAIGMTLGFNAGYAINPARDFGPRLFTAVAGWGADVFRAGPAWWWVPVVAPIAGAVTAGWVYDGFIGRRFPRRVASASAGSPSLRP
jgi:glycerol uptake facilitator-like aquaporin